MTSRLLHFPPFWHGFIIQGSNFVAVNRESGKCLRFCAGAQVHLFMRSTTLHRTTFGCVGGKLTCLSHWNYFSEFFFAKHISNIEGSVIRNGKQRMISKRTYPNVTKSLIFFFLIASKKKGCCIFNNWSVRLFFKLTQSKLAVCNTRSILLAKSYLFEGRVWVDTLKQLGSKATSPTKPFGQLMTEFPNTLITWPSLCRIIIARKFLWSVYVY